MTFIKDNIYRSAGALSFIFLAFAQCLPVPIAIGSVSFDIKPLYFVITAIVLASIDFCLIHKKMKSSKRTVVQNFSELLCMELKIVSENLKLTEKERINLYKYDDGGFFILQARYSESSEFRKAGRPAYSENEGAIGEAFNKGMVFHTNLPSPDGKAGLKSYISYCEKNYGMKKAVTKKITMKSRAYAAKVIRNSLGEKRAVLLIETLNKDFTHLVQDAGNGKVLDDVRVKSFLERESNRIGYLFELHNSNNSMKYAHSEGL